MSDATFSGPDLPLLEGLSGASARVRPYTLSSGKMSIRLMLSASASATKGEQPWVHWRPLRPPATREVHEKTYARGYAAPGMQAAADSLGSAFASRAVQLDAAEV